MIDQCSEHIDGQIFYESMGNDYQGEFRTVSSVWLPEDLLETDGATMTTKLTFDEQSFDPVSYLCIVVFVSVGCVYRLCYMASALD
jgi:hypothetical protein